MEYIHLNVSISSLPNRMDWTGFLVAALVGLGIGVLAIQLIETYVK